MFCFGFASLCNLSQQRNSTSLIAPPGERTRATNVTGKKKVSSVPVNLRRIISRHTAGLFLSHVPSKNSTSGFPGIPAGFEEFLNTAQPPGERIRKRVHQLVGDVCRTRRPWPLSAALVLQGRTCKTSLHETSVMIPQADSALLRKHEVTAGRPAEQCGGAIM